MSGMQLVEIGLAISVASLILMSVLNKVFKKRKSKLIDAIYNER